MGDSLITIVAIVLAAILMFVFPLMAMSDRTDDISELTVQTATTDFVDTVRTTGKLSLDDYAKFEQKISATGNSYDIEMEANPNKIGENVSYSLYTEQILDTLNNKKSLSLKEGDMFSTSVKNTNITLSQQLKNFFYTVAGNDTYTIAAQHGGYVTANGSGE